MLKCCYIWTPVANEEQRTRTYRWYLETHGPECMRHWGPWLTRYETYAALPPPPEAVERFGVWNHRITEHWWRSADEFVEADLGSVSYTWPGAPRDRERMAREAAANPDLPRTATAMAPAKPTHDFLGQRAFTPFEKTYIRWYILFRYPDGVSVDEGDNWFIETHAKEAMQQPGLLRYFAHRIVAVPEKWISPTPWHWLIEMWYEDLNDWRKALVESPPRYTRPSWATNNEYPFVKPAVEFVSTFVGETPEIDFLKDCRPKP